MKEVISPEYTCRMSSKEAKRIIQYLYYMKYVPGYSSSDNYTRKDLKNAKEAVTKLLDASFTQKTAERILLRLEEVMYLRNQLIQTLLSYGMCSDARNLFRSSEPAVIVNTFQDYIERYDVANIKFTFKGKYSKEDWRNDPALKSIQVRVR